MADEIVYILTNEAMQGYVKLGRTSNLEQRLKSLDTTSVPLPFECFYAARVKDATYVERQLHDAFDDHRVRQNREFFEISPSRIASALKLAELEEVTPKKLYAENIEDEKAIEKARERRSAFNFEMVRIPPNSILTFSRDQSITCTVVDKKKVLFENEITSLSAAAEKLLSRQGYNWPAQGPLYWIYEGETLEERRKKMEEGESY
ncbi:MAG: GIY-YIG nuclease family protein [Alphaproteobacteria bacterium]|nr:GIY-YIG nuclease family protein [Alphaproteobacteria bacterium]